MNMISDSLTSCTDSNFVSCLLFLAFNVLVLMYLIEQVERGAGTSRKTEKIQVTNKHKRVKEETDSNDSEFWMLKSSSGSKSESEQESDEENCKGSHCDAKEYENKEDVNRDWTKYDHYGSATMIMRLKATIQSLKSILVLLLRRLLSMLRLLLRKCPRVFTDLNSELQEKLAERSYAVASKITDNSLYHFCVFSDNIVATSVVVNSTALNSKAPEKVVFHLVTNDINYTATKSWFTMNMDNLRGVTVDVQKFEDFKWLNASYVPVLKQLQD
ncbi:hypothetical protein IGI04_018677 [Brassica rapa subsp. trilocularis]|uniref:Hexosyltransferase n=1 Tax=Brassica rapa subsp. trilocularis TaxID=1813537 RepID=A0ABQ7MDP7_BRACM|nr:hypothetical protein IGI04_018677 [Brassica rapa subsp. trilocularis]